MPYLTFVLPHWLYWSGLLIFPIVAMLLVRRTEREGARRRVSLSIAYLLWLTSGFVGLHRLYVHNFWGLLYIPLFVLILYGNGQGREARNGLSDARNTFVKSEFLAERAEGDVARGVEGAAAKLAELEATAAAAEIQFGLAEGQIKGWQNFSGALAAAIAVFMLLDAALLPGLTRRRAAIEGEGPLVETPHYAAPAPADQAPTPPLSRAIDVFNGWTDNFVAYWSLIAVFVYYYEVLARYVFNSPTNWAHEGMFLMFGMQYLISGAFAYREGAHVRVDVIYTHFSPRGKAVTDLVTSVFFFIFAGALLWSGWTFMMDSVAVREVSFNEWAIQYWPVKITITLGAAFILLQGLSKLLKDVTLLRQGTA